MPTVDDTLVARAETDLRQAEAASTAAQARADAAQAEAAAAGQRAKEMRAVWEWLKSQSAPPPDEPAGQAQAAGAMRFGRPVPQMPISDLCFQALENYGRPAMTKQIRERLARDGHDFTQAQVRAAMKYLSRKANPAVETTPGSGLWRLRRTQESIPFQPAAPIPAVNGARGET